MLTNNYKRWKNSLPDNASLTNYSQVGYGYNMKLTNTNNVTTEGLTGICYQYSPTTANIAHWATNIFVGTGDTTPEAETNYNLDNIVPDSDITHGTGSMTFNADTGILLFTKTFTYTGTDPIDIKEIGLIKGWGGSSNNYRALLAREVLETPISVSTGDIFTVTMTIG